MGNFAESLLGKRFGRLTVTGRVSNAKSGNSRWACICDCGGTTISTRPSLISGNSKSCGCLQSESASSRAKTHGKSHENIYQVWANMKRRCNATNSQAYSDYGARGIKVCDEWLDFEAFFRWSNQNGYSSSQNLSIERIDNNGNYEPENCKWASKREQARNRRSNRNITYNGKTHCVREWAEILGINHATLSTRLYRGWSIEKAFNFNTPRE